MGVLDDYLNRGKKKEETFGQTNFQNVSQRTSSALDDYLAKSRSLNRPASNLDAGSWMNAVYSLSQRVGNDYTKRRDSYQNPDDLYQYKRETNTDIHGLLDQAYNFRYQYKLNREGYDKAHGAGKTDEMISSLNQGIDYLRNLSADLDREYDYWSQWETEDDYKKWQEQVKEYERLSSYDVEGGKSNLEVLQAQLDEANAQYDNAKWEYGRQGATLLDGKLHADDPDWRFREQWDRLAENERRRDELQAQVDALSQDVKQAEEFQTANRYNALTEEPDFKEYSQKGEALKNPTMEEWDARDKRNFNSDIVGNVVTFSRDNWMRLLEDRTQGKFILGDPIYRFMQDDEVNIYNYLLAKEGEKSAQQYLDALSDMLNYRSGMAQAENIKNLDPAMRTLATGLYGVQAGAEQFGRGIQQIFTDEALPTTATQYGSAQVREDLADTGWRLPDWLGGASLGQMAYDTVTTTTNMAPSILLSAVTGGLGAPSALASGIGAATLGASAGGNAVNQALKEGYSKEQARTYGLLVGASEAGLSYLLGGISSLGGKASGHVIQNTVQNIDNALLRIAADTGLHMLSEGTEEYLQDILEPAFRNLIFDENNEIKLVSSDAAYSFLLGSLTAGLLEGGNIARSDINFNQLGKSIRESGNYEALLENALNLPETTEAHQTAVKLRDGSLHANNVNVGELFAGYAEAGGNVDFLNPKEEAPSPAQDENSVSGQALPSALREALDAESRTGSISNSATERILNDPQATDALAQSAGLTLSQGMTMSQRRNAVREAVKALALRSETTPGTSRVYSRPNAENASAAAEGAISGAAGRVLSGPDARTARSLEELAGTMGKAGGRALTALYDPAVELEAYFPAMTAYYNAGRNGADISSARTESAGVLNRMQREAAYLSGQADATAQNAENTQTNLAPGPNPGYTENNQTLETEGARYEEGNNLYLRTGGQRNGSTDSGGQIRILEEGAGRAAGRNAQARPKDGGAASLAYGPKVSAASLGISSASNEKNIRLVAGGDTAATARARETARKQGLRLTLFAGNNLEIVRDGKKISARAYVTGDRVFVRADHPDFDADQLMRHEAGHAQIRRGEIDLDSVRREIAKRFTSQELDEASANYAAAYEGSGMSAEEIWEEVVCDSLGDMNIFAAMGEKGEQNSAYLAEVKDAAKQTQTARGPPRTGENFSREEGGKRNEQGRKENDRGAGGTSNQKDHGLFWSYQRADGNPGRRGETSRGFLDRMAQGEATVEIKERGTGGIDSALAEEPNRAWTREGIIEPAGGSVAQSEQQTAMEYGIPSFVVSDEVWEKNAPRMNQGGEQSGREGARGTQGTTEERQSGDADRGRDRENRYAAGQIHQGTSVYGRAPAGLESGETVPAFSAGGQIYLRETLPEDKRGMFVPHEANHVMRQTGFAPYLDFVDRTPDMLDMGHRTTQKLLAGVGKQRGIDPLNMTEAERVILYDELNATIYSSIAINNTDDLDLIRPAFHDFDAYAAELSDIHRQFKESRRSRMEKARETGADENWERFSYAGINAQNADGEALDRAKELLAQGEEADAVRRETGWFRGMDGKWRFEIDDSGAEFSRNGFADAPKLLPDYLKHDVLYDAYPKLREIEVGFLPMQEGERAAFLPEYNAILLNDLIRDDSLLKRSLLHETQHAIQRMEGFDTGSSLDYWVKKAYPSAEELAKNLPGYQQLKADEDRAEFVWNYMRAFGYFADALQKYRSNAGEIEARDTAARADLTAAQRKSAAPDVKHPEATFTGDQVVSYSLEPYSEKQLENWATSKNITVYQDQAQLNRFIQNALDGHNLNQKMYFGSIPSDLAARIQAETGIDVNGYNCTLRATEIRKIIKSHGSEKTESPRGQRAIRKQDFLNIPKVIQSPDSIQLGSELYQGKPVILFSKMIDGKLTVVAYVSRKHMDLTVQTMYAGKKQGNLATAADAKAPATTPKAHVGTVPATIIPQSSANDNSNFADFEKNNGGKASFEPMPGFEERIRKMTPAQIAGISREEANATPKLKARPGGSGINAETGRESRFYESAMRSAIVDGETRPLVESFEDVKYYLGVSNLETLQAANERLNALGGREAFRFGSLDPAQATAVDVAEGFILLKRFQDAGDHDSAVEVLRKLREMGTSAGQTVQAFSLLGRLTPEGMAVYAQKELDAARAEMVKKHGEAWAEKRAEMFELTPEEVAFIRGNIEKASMLPEGRDKNVLIAEIASLIESKLPTNILRQLKAYTRNAMLLNPKTMLRNVIGNAIMMPAYAVQDFIGAGADRLLSKITGVRTKGALPSGGVGKAALKGVYESYDDFRRKINTRQSNGDRFEIGEGDSFRRYRREQLKAASPARRAAMRLSNALNMVDRVTGFLLDVGDRPFFEYHFTSSLNNQLKLNHAAEPTAEMIELATTEALQRTWQDDNALTKAVTSLRNSLNFGKEWGLGSIIVPFTKTPANLTKALIEYSPLGLVNTVANAARLYTRSRKSKSFDPKTQKAFVDSLSKAITGTLAMALGGVLADMGVLSGGDDDKDRDLAAFEKNILGMAPYSVTVNGRSYAYDWAQPIGGLFAISADYVQNVKNGNDPMVSGLDALGAGGNAILNALTTGGNVLFEQSFLQGVSQLFAEEGLVAGLIESASGAASQFVPTALSQIAQMIDPYARTSFEYRNIPQTTVNKALSKIPGARENLTPVVDVLGHDVESYGGNNSLFNVFFNPANLYSETATRAALEIYRVYEETGDLSVIPRLAPYYLSYEGERYSFTAAERAEYQRTAGRTNEELVNELLRSNAYGSLSDEDQAGVLSLAADYANALAKYEYLKGHNVSYKRDGWMLEAEAATGAGLSAGDYLLAYFLQQDVRSGLKYQTGDKAGETIPNSKSLLVMEAIYSISGLTDKQREYLFECFDVGKSVRHYNKAAVAEHLNKMRRQ